MAPNLLVENTTVLAANVDAEKLRESRVVEMNLIARPRRVALFTVMRETELSSAFLLKNCARKKNIVPGLIAKNYSS